MQFACDAAIIWMSVEADHAVIFVFAYALISSFIGEFVSAGQLIREFWTLTAYAASRRVNARSFSPVSLPISVKR